MPFVIFRRDHLRFTSGIICGPIWGSFPVWGSFAVGDHLRRCTAVLSDINLARALFKLLDDFQKLLGLRVNCTKTEGMWIGSLRQNKVKPRCIKWSDEPIKALGVYYSYDPKLPS